MQPCLYYMTQAPRLQMADGHRGRTELDQSDSRSRISESGLRGSLPVRAVHLH